MPKLTSCCVATMALLALTLSAHAWPDSAMARAAGLYSAAGAGPIILIADESKAGDDKKAVEKRSADEKKAGDEKKPVEGKAGDEKKSADNQKKTRRERNVSKREIMRKVRRYLPSEYHDYIDQGGGYSVKF